MRPTFLPGFRAPAWLLVALGLALLLLGGFLVVRPFASVEVFVLLCGVASVLTGTAELAEPVRSRWRRWSGAGWIALGLVLLIWPGVSVAGLAVIVGVGLLLSGGRGLAELRGEPGPAAAAVTALTAGTSVIFGVLALSWPDVTVFVVGVLFGARMVWSGLAVVVDAIRGRPRGSRLPRHRSGWTVVTHAAALAIALCLLAISVVLHGQVRTSTSFYDWSGPPPTTPGQLLRSEPFTGTAPAGSTAQLILYATTASAGRPAVGSAILFTPSTRAAPTPVILWDHGTTGIARNCAPSLSGNPLANVPALTQALSRGWAVVAPDYVGMGTAGVSPYLIGTGEAWSGLDAVRAARRLDPQLGRQTVVWGHSQGGHAALWTGLAQPTYAPDVPLAGVAALAPATDVRAMADVIQGHVGGSLGGAYVLSAYAGTYPDVHVDSYVRAGARANVATAAARCTNETGLLASIITSLPAKQSIFAVDPTTGAAGKRLIENTPTAAIAAPLLIAQGTADEVLPFSITTAWIGDQCTAGHHLDFRRFPNGTHMSILGPDSDLTPQLLSWTADRLAGKPATPTC